MATYNKFEDFTTWSPGETDPLNHLTVQPTNISIAGLSRDEDTYHTKDLGSNYLDGDFTHQLKVRTLGTSQSTSAVSVMSVTNVIDDLTGLITTNEDALTVSLIHTTMPTLAIQLREIYAGTSYNVTYYGTADTWYVLVMRRDETYGSYGALYLDIYDETKSVLLDTISLALHAKIDFRYVMAVQSIDDNVASTLNGDVALWISMSGYFVNVKRRRR
jgi:hypothetical protein